MNVILSEGMFHIILLGGVVPIGMKFMDLNGDIFQLFNIDGFVYFTEASFPK